MSETRRFQCLNCGHQFEAEVLTDREKEDARRQRQPVSSLACPKCNRTDVRRGWS
ncbi:zinc ribbon domain-containing protein [Mesorhizobium sp. M1A.F.Ca.IN.022.07.1.1]|nr:zinc ribbon domain-containing protein [Mesorhizobium sp. M1A.F.Ca.IN.022.07.1.1]TIS70186.1 MAG: zinc ribbon domain-containing protein [Mesorhizobium sp.]